ncbi:MAG: hypothetical protein SGJ01_17275 [Gemmatimonadota bacterium]|nr:hypothetical protein [Gemmatimonadota bacterium]
MNWDRRWTRDMFAAASLLAGSGGLFGWAASRLLTLDVTPAARAMQLDSVAAKLLPRQATPAAIRHQAILADPFRPERSPASIAFRMPSDASAGVAVVSHTPEEGLVLVGTALLPDGRSFAMCRIGADPPRVVRVGERVGEYTLRLVTQGQARFETAAGRIIDVRVPKAGS